MKRKWMAVGFGGIKFDGDLNKLKLAIFRVAENNRAYPMLVKPSELQLDDLLYLDTTDKSGYARLEDFHRKFSGEVDFWCFSACEIPIQKQTAMMHLTKQLLSKEYSPERKTDDTVLVSIRQDSGNA